MWDSNMSDEFFVAVKEFNLSWHEIVTLSRNSLRYSFAPEEMKERLLSKLNKRLSEFEKSAQHDQAKLLQQVNPVAYSFICKKYAICSFSQTINQVTTNAN